MNLTSETIASKEQTAIEKSIAAAKTKLRQLEKRVSEQFSTVRGLERKLQRLKVSELKQVPNGVKLSYSWHTDRRIVDLIGKPGTLIDVRRTLATVDFGGVRWDIPVENLIAFTQDPTDAVIGIGGGK